MFFEKLSNKYRLCTTHIYAKKNWGVNTVQEELYPAGYFIEAVDSLIHRVDSSSAAEATDDVTVTAAIYDM